MLVLRPATEVDITAITELAQLAGTGLTTLPKGRDKITQKVEWSESSFRLSVTEAGNEYYLFVLEDTHTGEVIGTSALAAAVGLHQPFYTYKVGTVVHASRKLGIHNRIETLILGHDYTGTTEVCTLFLSPYHRGGSAGKLLSKGRFLFIHDHPDRFSDKVIAEMRGYSDQNGKSPFWESLGRHFFSLEFDKADSLSGEETNEFIAELMPTHPIYVPLLSEAAQDVIGKVHPDTEPARKLLEKEGFRYRGYVDIFDAGPTLEVSPHNIETIKHSATLRARVEPPAESDRRFLVSNGQTANFRCGLIAGSATNDYFVIAPDDANQLGITDGQLVTISKLR